MLRKRVSVQLYKGDESQGMHHLGHGPRNIH